MLVNGTWNLTRVWLRSPESFRDSRTLHRHRHQEDLHFAALFVEYESYVGRRAAMKPEDYVNTCHGIRSDAMQHEVR